MRPLFHLRFTRGDVDGRGRMMGRRRASREEEGSLSIDAFAALHCCFCLQELTLPRLLLPLPGPARALSRPLHTTSALVTLKVGPRRLGALGAV